MCTWYEANAEEKLGPRRPRSLWEQELCHFRPNALGHTCEQHALRTRVVARAVRTLTGGGGGGGEQGDVLGCVLLDGRGRQLALLLAPLVGHEEPDGAALGGGGTEGDVREPPDSVPMAALHRDAPTQGHAQLLALFSRQRLEVTEEVLSGRPSEWQRFKQ